MAVRKRRRNRQIAKTASTEMARLAPTLESLEEAFTTKTTRAAALRKTHATLKAELDFATRVYEDLVSRRNALRETSEDIKRQIRNAT